MLKLTGVPASSGIAVGPAFVLSDEVPDVPDVDSPKEAFLAATAAVSADLRSLGEQATAEGRSDAAEVLGAQALMAEDPMFVDAVHTALDEGEALGAAIDRAASEIAEILSGLSDPYLAARSADVLEVASRVARHLAGAGGNPLDGLAGPSVIVARSLSAADTAQLDPGIVLGFVTEEGGPTGHVAVIARSLSIPAVVGVPALMDSVDQVATVGLDGATGEVAFDPDDDERETFAGRAKTLEEARLAATAYRGRVISFDGSPFLVSANVGGPSDVKRAGEAQADGIGLYRTEFLFLDRESPPTEEEQFEAYAEAARSFDKPVVIRTFDIGGDKPAPYLDTPEEENPFLGERGVRLYPRFDTLFRTQASALVRASAFGDLWIMVPMVATVEDAVSARRVISDVRSQLESAGARVGAPRVGVMIEVPSAALIARELARHVDFFSIGTNDLTQYTMAADRGNPRLAGYSDAAHPAVLRLCLEVAEAGIAGDISVSVCGEAAADPVLARLFAAMGISKLSMAPPSVDLVKALVSETDPALVRAALQAALDSSDATGARARAQEVLGTTP